MLNYLVETRELPAGLVAVEYSIKVNELDKRCDAVVFSKDGNPLMILECKAASVKLTQSTLEQAVRYHSVLQPKYLMLFNGQECYCFKSENGALKALDRLPSYFEL